jgi:hypothetical protein
MRSTALQRPLVPEDLRRGGRPGDAIFRAAVAHFVSRQSRDCGPEQIAERLWSDDVVTKAATAPATTTTSGWATPLVAAAVADAVVGLAPLSGAAELIRRGLRVSLNGGSITVPRRLMVAADAGGFVGEGEPLQVRNLSVTGGPTLNPFKLGVITAFTNELAKRSVSDIEAVVKQMLSEASALVLDSAIFSTTAASAIRPAGILVGLTPLTATTGGGETAMNEDLAALAAAVAPVGGPVLFIAAPKQAAAISLRYGADASKSLATSSALADGTVVAVATAGFVSAFGSEPEFQTSEEVLLHMEDSAPAAIGTTGTPAVVAAPSLSMFQVNCTAVKMILRASWGLRAANAAAMVEAVTW